MSTNIAISPAVMINRMVHEKGVPPGAQLAEVARLRGQLIQANAENAAAPLPTTAPTTSPANGAEVDLLI